MAKVVAYVAKQASDTKRDVKYDWATIKTEYVTTTISYRKLADKWAIPRRTLEQRAKMDCWTAERDEYQGKTAAATIARVSRKTSITNAQKLIQLQEGTVKLSDFIVEQLAKDPKQFFRHIVQTRDGDSWDAEERIFKKLDTKSLKELTGAMRDLGMLMRDLFEIPTLMERAAMDIAAERLRMDQQKAEIDNPDAQESGVIEIPAINITPVEDEPEEEAQGEEGASDGSV